MKKVLLFLTCCFLFTTTNIFAQSPEKINYQAIVKDNNGDAVSNQNISVQIKINQDTANGTTIYTETHTITTAADGLITLVIGDGTTTDNLAIVQWHKSTFFLNVAVDLNAGSNYTDLGTQQLVAVPYALHANTANNLKAENGETQVQANTNDIKLFNNVFNTFTFSSGKLTTNAAIANFGNNLQLEFKDDSNTNSISNIFPNVTTIPTPGNADYELNLNVRGNETLSARGNGTVRFNNAFTFPNADGNAGQALVTDGSGTVSWASSSNLADTDGDTKIQVEENTDEDIIRFDLEGTEYFRMQKGRIDVVNSGLSVYLGENAGLNDNLTDNENVAIGYKALEANATGGSNTAVGAFAMNLSTGGTGNTAIGIGALERLQNGNENVAVGAGALGTTVGSTITGNGSGNVALGYRAGFNNRGRNNIFLGRNTDISGSVSDKLVIDNTNTTTPLIYGEFDNNLVRVNGNLNTTGNTTTNGATTTTGNTTTGTLKIGSSSTIAGIYKAAVFKNVGNVGGNDGRTETFTVNGVVPGDVVFVSPSESLSGQIVIVQCWVSGNNTVSVKFRNTDGGSRDPDGGDGATYYFGVIK